MKKITYSLVISILSLLLCAGDLLAENFKVATIDLNRALNESEGSKLERKSLDTKTTEAKKKIEAQKKNVMALEKKVKEGNLGEDSKEYQNLNKEMKDLNRLAKDSEEEIKREFLKTNKKLTDNIVAAVQKYAKENGLDLVIDKSDKIRGPVVFGDAGLDITDEIIKALNTK